jgi:transposase InsO family protein
MTPLSEGTYGKDQKAVHRRIQGVACSENRIARLMRLRGLRAKQSKRFRATTKHSRTHRIAPNLLNREFTADRPDQKWLTDITYI